MTEPLLLIDRGNGIATVTFNDPARLNAMTEAMGEAISNAMNDLAKDDALRAVVLTGAGRAFSAGGDLDMIDRMGAAGRADPGGATRAENRDFMRRFYGLYLSVRDLPQPTIAAVNGHAIGAGCCVALACDIRLAANEAKLGLNFTRLGIHPGMAATWTLPRLVGPAHAAELLFTGRLLEGPEAAQMGMVNRSLPRERVVEEALAMADTIAQASPLAVRGTKRSLARTATASLDEQLAIEAHEQSLCYEDADLAEGLMAAREKRPARFSGR
ncbi:MAG: enoyl-CoA hydratase/isomerase family protein [Deltaproteobacteria bacterium]|nr:enoyl-CoA hydratase/isomerase family protein [Deltaproteobacteria bacterium]MBW2361465.1 enoyl-CoA hydratase/isomerase family protein [Deltaproteobacteria bacterium]